jgi:hypothetical protein
MATIQQSIEINVPVHAVYDQLTRFEDYPRFMEEVETVQQLDDTHLHWKTIMSNRSVEWDAEISELEADRCIAWHNTSGPANAGKVELQPAGPDASRVTFTLQAEPQQVPGSSAGSSEQEMARRLKLDLARLKDLIETRGRGTAASDRADRDGAGKPAGSDVSQAAGQQQESKQSELERPGRSAPVPASSHAAGSEGWAGDEDPIAPVLSASGSAAEQRNDSAGSVPAAQAPSPSPSGAGSDSPQDNESTQSDYSLSKSADDRSADDGRFSVAEEVNLDQQSDAVRHVGQMPRDTTAEHHGGTAASDAMGKAMRRDS